MALDEKAMAEHVARKNKKKADLNAKEIESLKASLSVRERLERKLEMDVIKVELDDDLGKVTLSFRKLSVKEHDKFVQLQQSISASAHDPKKQAELNDQLFELLGKISQDGLDKAFWKEGNGYSPDILATALMKVLAASVYPEKKYLEEINQFRQQ